MVATIAIALIAINFSIFCFGVVTGGEVVFEVMAIVCVAQFIVSIVVLGQGRRIALGVVGLLLSIVGGLVALAGAVLSSGALSGLAGGAWGRPLRVRGRQLHPELKTGADWTGGEQPSRAGLDAATCRALEALWLHDAQKEHASVPAFSRVSWLLAAVGAPAELMAWTHRAALEEIDHARRCFALAAGYGGRSFTVEPMPELVVGGLGDVKDPLVALAVESLTDGCLLEDFNADVAKRCAAVCTAPVTHRVLEQIAREERSHAELSWALIAWLVASHESRVVPALIRALERLEQVARPTSATATNQALVAAADPVALRQHGRLEDREWAACWAARLTATRARMTAMLGVQRQAA